MSTNLEYRAREIRWQASEGQRENGRQRSRATDKIFFFWRTTWKFCSGGDKMRNAGSQQANARWTWGAVKKSDLVRTHTPPLLATSTSVNNNCYTSPVYQNYWSFWLPVGCCESGSPVVTYEVWLVIAELEGARGGTRPLNNFATIALKKSL